MPFVESIKRYTPNEGNEDEDNEEEEEEEWGREEVDDDESNCFHSEADGNANWVDEAREEEGVNKEWTG